MSTADTSWNRPNTAADYLAILRRRLWIIIALPILTAAVAYSVAAQESPQYKAVSSVRFVASNASTQAFENPSPILTDPTFLPTQATIAREHELAERVAADPRADDVTPEKFLGESSATTQSDVNILDLAVTDANPDTAVALANVYADQFREYKIDQDTASLKSSIKAYDHEIRDFKRRGLDPSALYESKAEAVAKAQALVNNVRVSSYAGGASKTRPMPKRAAILGGLLGAVLALGIALLAEALDRRVRSEKEIEETLGVPLLGRLPRPSRRLRKGGKLVMLQDPTSFHAETFRKLRTSIEFVNFDTDAQTIMVTSAGPREGKSTTVANLAVAFARAGRRVVLVDLDLRRPSLHHFFNASGANGLTDVVVDRVALQDAIRPIVLPAAAAYRDGNGRQTANGAPAPNGRGNAEGVLHFLPAGTIPPAADELLARPRVAGILEQLAAQADLVLVDAPPLLAVGDAQTLSAVVDGMVVVSRLGAHRRQLQELARQLPRYRADVLGFILTGVSHSDSYSYGYGYDPHVYSAPRETRRRGQRV